MYRPASAERRCLQRLTPISLSSPVTATLRPPAVRVPQDTTFALAGVFHARDWFQCPVCPPFNLGVQLARVWARATAPPLPRERAGRMGPGQRLYLLTRYQGSMHVTNLWGVFQARVSVTHFHGAARRAAPGDAMLPPCHVAMLPLLTQPPLAPVQTRSWHAPRLSHASGNRWTRVRRLVVDLPVGACMFTRPSLSAPCRGETS